VNPVRVTVRCIASLCPTSRDSRARGLGTTISIPHPQPHRIIPSPPRGFVSSKGTVFAHACHDKVGLALHRYTDHSRGPSSSLCSGAFFATTTSRYVQIVLQRYLDAPGSGSFDTIFGVQNRRLSNENDVVGMPYNTRRVGDGGGEEASSPSPFGDLGIWI
jgi:hypothetical protein